MLASLFDQVYFSNSLRLWGIAIAIGGTTFLALMIARRLLVARLGAVARRTATDFDDILVELAARTKPYFLAAVAVVVGSRSLTLPSRLDDYFRAALALAFLAQFGLWATSGVNLWIQRHAARPSSQSDATSVSTMRALGIAAKVVLWTIVFIMALGQFGINITALVTGLGIGGVALALAVQNILGDLLAALSIVFDKPFDVGDAIAVDQMTGTVEHIGLKTTRLRSYMGEQIIVSNSELLKSRIRNLKRRYERRVALATDVRLDTDPELVARIPGWIRDIVTAQHPVRFDRSHFVAYTDSALRIETVYYVLDPAEQTYLDIQQTVNLELLRRLHAEHVRLAFPTRTVLTDGALTPAAERGRAAT